MNEYSAPKAKAAKGKGALKAIPVAPRQQTLLYRVGMETKKLKKLRRKKKHCQVSKLGLDTLSKNCLVMTKC